MPARSAALTMSAAADAVSSSVELLLPRPFSAANATMLPIAAMGTASPIQSTTAQTANCGSSPSPRHRMSQKPASAAISITNIATK